MALDNISEISELMDPSSDMGDCLLVACLALFMPRNSSPSALSARVQALMRWDRGRIIGHGNVLGLLNALETPVKVPGTVPGRCQIPRPKSAYLHKLATLYLVVAARRVPVAGSWWPGRFWRFDGFSHLRWWLKDKGRGEFPASFLSTTRARKTRK